MRWVLAGGICVAGAVAVFARDTQPEAANQAKPPAAAEQVVAADELKQDSDREFVTQTLRGRVVWLADALEEEHDIKVTPDAKERVLALKTQDGELIPLIEDRRGRAFRTDERLRDREVELLVRRYHGVPLAQIIRTYTIQPDGKFELDYWCEICAISMVELGVCDCCQAPNELRERKVE